MSKGKKFDAHKKHFDELEIKIKKDLKECRDINFRLSNEIEELKNNVCKLEEENKQLSEALDKQDKINKKLRTLINIPDDELKVIVKSELDEAKSREALRMLSAAVSRFI